MSQPTLTPEAYSVLKQRITAFAVVDIGSSGAPTLMAWTPTAGVQTSGYAAAITSAPTVGASAGSQLAASIVRNSTGNYTLTMQSTYQRIVGLHVTFSVPTTGIPAARSVGIVTPAGGIDAPGAFSSVNFVCSTSGSATDPASGEQMMLQIEIDNSGVV